MFCSKKKSKNLCMALPAAVLIVIGFTSIPVLAAADETRTLRMINAEQTFRLLGQEDVVIIDNRQPELFRSGHIQGAVNMVYHKPESPQNQMTRNMLEPFRKKTLVFYCSGGHRARYGAYKALEWDISTEVFWFKGGWPEWQEYLTSRQAE